MHNITCVSRKYGWDITNSEEFLKLVDMTADADVFLNVAHVGYTQGILLEQSKAKINISFGSLVTNFKWSRMKLLCKPEYFSEKLFLNHVHNNIVNSALINISKYGNTANGIPSVTSEQIIYAIDNVISGKSILPTTIEISNGLGDLLL